MGVPCPRCGRETRILIRGLCPQCFAEVYGLARLPGRVEVEICRYCYSVRIGRRWVPVSSFDEAVEAIARDLVSKARPMEPLEGVELERVEYETLPNWTTRAILRLSSTHRGVPVRGVASVVVQLRASVCPTCKVRVSGEYDTLLQVRGGDPERVERMVVEAIEEAGLAPQTVDLIRGRDGVDVYFTNPGAARKVAKRLQRLLGGRIERMNYETVGLDSSGRLRARRTLTLRIDK